MSIALAGVPLTNCGGGSNSAPGTVTPPPPPAPKPVKLNAPWLTLNDNIVSWNSIPHASGYQVNVRNAGSTIPISTETKDTKFEHSEKEPGSYYITAKALGDGEKYTDSIESAPVTRSIVKKCSYVNCVCNPCNCKEDECAPKEKPNTDPYNEEGALLKALNEFSQKIAEKVIPESDWKALSDELKEVFVEAYARDKYSAKLPFTSEEIRKGLTIIEYRFPDSSDTAYYEDFINLGTKHKGGLGNVYIHETAHHLGFGEAIAEYINNKYAGKPMGVKGIAANLDNLLYSPYYDNLLAERVGEEKFWATIYESRDGAEKRYVKMWDDNMTINGQKTPLVTWSDMAIGKGLSYYARNRRMRPEIETFVGEYEKFAGVKNVEEEFVKIGMAFESALGGDPTAIKQVQDFFKSVVDYNNTVYRLLWTNPIFEFSFIKFWDAVHSKEKTVQSDVKQVGCVAAR